MNRIVVVSNRVQVPREGVVSAGGLAVALDGLMAKRGGLWFGWSGNVSPDPSRSVSMTTVGAMQYATIDLSPDEHDRYYNEFSNGTLWPLLHSMPGDMGFDRRSAQAYRQVNERMTDALLPLLRPTDLIWIHDYHLMAMPAFLRARGVDAPIGFFLHIPFPSPDMLASVPEAGVLIRDLLSADLLGFQTANDVENFSAAAHRLAGATRLSGGNGLQIGSRRVRLGAFPAEIDAHDFAAMATRAYHNPATERLRRSLNRQCLILGIDRMDPTKGLMNRLAGFRRLLETRPDWRGRVTFLQIAAESRKEVSAYKDLRLAIDREAGAINSEWGEPDWTPLRVVARGGSRETVSGYMREARVGLVTPLRDGMNLVAKEYIAAQDPQDPGVLVLSKFAGAARQLSSALLVNPHDADELAEAMDRALVMPLAERQERWEIAWRAIEGATPALWGRNFLAALTRSSLTSPKGTPEAPSLAPPPAREPITLPALGIGKTTSGQDALTQTSPRGWPTRLS
jgi:trehalose 6-phosphate synthase